MHSRRAVIALSYATSLAFALSAGVFLAGSPTDRVANWVRVSAFRGFLLRKFFPEKILLRLLILNSSISVYLVKRESNNV